MRSLHAGSFRLHGRCVRAGAREHASDRSRKRQASSARLECGAAESATDDVFGCAQIRAHVPLWQRMYEPGESGRYNVSEKTDHQWNENDNFSRQSLNDIEMY